MNEESSKQEERHQILKNTNAKILDEFNASIMFDQELYAQDIKGSIAHSHMLCERGMISQEERASIEAGLLQVREEIESGQFVFSLKYEDIHMAVESRLTELIGEAGKKLHTARSRNDQVATDFRLYVQEHSTRIRSQLKELIATIVVIAERHTETLMPGMTHLQHAQPINFAYHLLAYAHMFRRDHQRFESAYERANESPLGSAALAGTPHPIDRDLTAHSLGFNAPTLHAMDSVSDRDFALDILFNISTSMMHISRLAEELILWSSYEFQFIQISDEYATTSSIMPQKKNPDVPELLRGKTGRVYGNLISLFTVMKALPLAYNKDTQEDKEGVFDSVKTMESSLHILREVIKTMTVRVNRMEEACQVGHLSATDLADFLVQRRGVPFRTAYYITKDVVAQANMLNKDLSMLTIEEIRSSHEVLRDVDEELLMYLDLRHSMNARDSKGGTSTQQTLEQIKFFQRWLKHS